MDQGNDEDFDEIQIVKSLIQIHQSKNKKPTMLFDDEASNFTPKILVVDDQKFNADAFYIQLG